MIIPAYFDTHIAVLLILSLISLGLSIIAIWMSTKSCKALENPAPCHGNPDDPEPDYPEPDLVLDMYVARDNSGALYLYGRLPDRKAGIWAVDEMNPRLAEKYDIIDDIAAIQLPIGTFPYIKCSDEKPTPVTVEISLKIPF